MIWWYGEAPVLTYRCIRNGLLESVTWEAWEGVNRVGHTTLTAKELERWPGTYNARLMSWRYALDAERRRFWWDISDSTKRRTLDLWGGGAR